MSGHNTKRSSSRRLLVSVLISLVAGVLASGSASADFATQGELSINTEGGPLVARGIPWSTQLEIGDQAVSIGGAGENATAAYSVSIIDAAVSASTSAQNAPHAPGDYWSASGNVQNAQFRDDLHFTIPAGSYPAGLYVIARVYVSGSVGASLGATARHQYQFDLGLASVRVVTSAPAPNVSEIVVLEHELASPGTIFNNPAPRLVRFLMFVDGQSGAAGEVAQSASSDVSGSLICMEVPAAVTWTSDSGVFDPPDCEPDTDSDGVPDSTDNCTLKINSAQRDSNVDGIGNACDADLNGDCEVNFGDVAALKAAFTPRPYNPDADFDGDGFVNFGDLALMKSTFFNGADPGPGPSGLPNACE